MSRPDLRGSKKPGSRSAVFDFDAAAPPEVLGDRGIFEASRDMIYLSSRSGLLLDLNPAGADLLGYSTRDEVAALERTENLFYNRVHWEVFRREIERHGYVTDFEASFRSRSGERVHCLLSGNAVLSRAGEVAAYRGIAKDITARMEAVRALQQRHRELSILNALALAINAGQPLSEVLRKALASVLEVLGVDVGGVFLIDQLKADFYLEVDQGLPRDEAGAVPRVAIHDDLLRQALLSRDQSLEPQPAFPHFHCTLVGRDFAHSLRLTSFLITSQEKAWGFFALKIAPDRRLSTSELHLLGSLGNFLGGAIENARLLATVRQHREELRELTARLFESQESERRRIALELHDETGQALTGINFTMETIERCLEADPAGARELVGDVRRQINQTYQQIRDLSHSLHPALLNDMGLEPALEALFTRVSRYSGLAVDFRIVGFHGRPSQKVETVLYRLAQEAVTNAARHARATRFQLSVINGYPNIILVAEDNGIGFDAPELQPKRQTLRFLSMRERAAMMGGNFQLRKSESGGTRVRIEIPSEETPRE